MHSHEHLPQIFHLLWEKVSPKGSDLDLVLRFVMFHQSFCGFNDFPNMIDLNEDERKTVVGADKEFYRLMKIVMTADCYSYRFVIDPDGRWPIMKK